MSFGVRLHILLPLIALCLGASCVGPSVGSDYTDIGHRKPWYTLMRPGEATPEAQLAYARRLRETGHWIRASRHYRALVASWPAAPQAPIAQYEVAKMLDARGKAQVAFGQYQKLLDHYPGQCPFEEVLQRQFAIAKKEMDTRKLRLLFGGVRAPEVALPLLGHVVTNAPQATVASEAQYLIGWVHQQNGDYGQAAQAYTEAQYRYPGTPAAAKAAYGRALCLYRQSRQSQNDDRLAEEAWFALDLFLREHPDAPNAAQATTYRDELYRRRARIAYEKAVFYDRTARRPDAALMPYQLFVQRFPGTEWTDAAKRRIQQLEKNKAEARDETIPAEPEADPTVDRPDSNR